MQTWLRNRGVWFTDDMLKAELLELAKAHKPPPKYVVDDVIHQHEHEVLRLPPYHPVFKAIELIWSQLKHTGTRRNVTFR